MENSSHARRAQQSLLIYQYLVTAQLDGQGWYWACPEPRKGPAKIWSLSASTVAVLGPSPSSWKRNVTSFSSNFQTSSQWR